MRKYAFSGVLGVLAIGWSAPLFAQSGDGFSDSGMTASNPICEPACDPGPCFSLRAVAVNRRPIPPTNCVAVYPGDMIEAEILVSDWGQLIPDGVTMFQAQVDGVSGALSGSPGLVLPLGWDAPIWPIFCTHNVDCPPDLACHANLCTGPHHDPEAGFFTNLARPDYLFAGFPDLLQFTSANALQSLITVGVLDLDSQGSIDTGAPAYAATLRLEPSFDACGAFIYGFDPHGCILENIDDYPRPSDLSPLRIDVDCDCNDDGLVDWQAIAGGQSLDCNHNGLPDDCDISSGRFPDLNSDGIPDGCARTPTPRMPAATR